MQKTNLFLLNKIKTQLHQYGYFIFALTFFFILFFIMQNINNRFWLHDFEVYYSAANSFLQGNQVYGIAYGLPSGFYKYSPFALLIFVPFSLLPFFTAKVLHYIILSALIITTIIISDKIIKSNFFSQTLVKKQNLKLFLIFLPLIPNVYTELHLGNINIILLFVFLLALQKLLSDKYWQAALLISIGILVKPHFLIFLPLLLVRKKFKCVYTIILFLVLGILIPSIFSGFQSNILMHKDWIETMQSHNNSLISGQNTVFSWLYRSVVQFIFPEAVNYDKLYGFAVLGMIGIAFLTLLLQHLKHEKVVTAKTELIRKNFILEYLLILAMIPNLTVTDSEHFLLSIPLITFIIYFLFEEKISKIVKIFSVLFLIMYGINIHELVGKTLSAWLTDTGILGLANIFIISLCIYLYSIFRKKSLQAN